MSKLHVLVLQVEGGNMTVVTEDGDFLTVPTPWPTPRKGQRLWVATPARLRPALWLGAVAVAAAALIFVLLGRMQMVIPTPPIAAALTIDINPSLLLHIDGEARTIDVFPLNEDGRRLPLPKRGTPAADALAQLLAAARDLGYLRPGEEPIILYSVRQERFGRKPLDMAAALQQAITSWSCRRSC